MLSIENRVAFNGYIQSMRRLFPEKNFEPWVELQAAIMRDGDTGVLPTAAAEFLQVVCQELWMNICSAPSKAELHQSLADYLMRQSLIWFNKVDHDWNVTDLQMEVNLLKGEVAEVEEALSGGDRNAVLEELADVAIYCYGMAAILGKGLDEAIFTKMQVNTRRVYQDGRRVEEGL